MNDASATGIARGTAASAALGRGLRSALTAYADYLARISWRRFHLLGILGLIVVGFVNLLLPVGERAVEVTEGPIGGSIKLRLQVDPDGEVDVSADRIRPENAGNAKDPGPAQSGRPGDSGTSQPLRPGDDQANIRIGKDGLRIESKEATGESSVVVIDLNGVRVHNRPASTRNPSMPGLPAPDAPLASIAPVPPEASSVAASQWVEATNRRIAEANQQIAASQMRMRDVAEKVRQRAEQAVNGALDGDTFERIERRRAPDFLLPLYLVLFFASAMIKIIGADRNQAIARAGAAEADAEREALRCQVVEARLQALQAQVEPHFLFNTLGSVEYLIDTEPARAGVMLNCLIQYLRAALPRMRSQSTTLGEEAELVRAYLEILKFRMEERLRYQVDIPLGLASAGFPPMMLQSIVENAIKHGIEPKTDGGAIALSAALADGRLHVTVADTGLGLGLSPVAGTGIGLSNIRERLQAQFGERGRLVVESNPPGGTLVRIEIPYSVAAAPQAAAARSGAPVA